MSPLPVHLVDVLGATLLHSLWQGALVALVAAAALARLRDPARRYRVAALALAALLLWPLASGVGRALQTSDPALAPPSAGGPSLSVEIPPARERTGSAAPPATTAAGLERAPAASPAASTPAASRPAAPEAWRTSLAPLLVALWLAGVLAGLTRLAIAVALVERLRRSARPAAAPTVAAAERLARDLGVRARVAVLETHRLAAPVVIGALRPALLLPTGVAASLPPAQFEAVLAHELAHVLRRDYLVNLLQRLAETLLFHHPAAWWLSRVVRTEREHLCDDAAVRAGGGDPLPLARALAALEERRASGPVVAVAARGDGAPGGLLARVARLLGRAPGRRGPPAGLLVLQAGVPALLLALAALLAPAAAQIASASDGMEVDEPYPYALRYGLGTPEPGAWIADARLHLDIELGDLGFINVRTLDAEGAEISAFDLEGSRAWGIFSVLPEGVRTLELSTTQGTWRLPLELNGAPLEPIAAPKTVDETDPQQVALVWDGVPGAEAYRVAVMPQPSDSDRPGGWYLTRDPRLSLAGLPPGRYRADVTAYSRTPYAPGTALRTDIAQSGSVDLDVPSVPEPSGPARGVVTGEVRLGALPAADVVVELTPISFDDGRFDHGVPRRVLSGPDGRYRAGGLRPGAYLLRAAPAELSDLPPEAASALPSFRIGVGGDAPVEAPPLYTARRLELRQPPGGLASAEGGPLVWSAQEGAVAYRAVLFEERTDPDGETRRIPVASIRTELPQWAPPLEPGARYELRVDALDAAGYGVGVLAAEVRTVE